MPTPATSRPTAERPSPTAPSGPPLFTMAREDCMRLQHALRREWLLADGLGGYATSTVLMCPTRRYHGLLTAPAITGPGAAKRHLFLARYEEHAVRGETRFPLSIARYRGLWSPQGHRSLESFELVPFPSALYRIGSASIRREILVPRGRHAVLVRFGVSGAEPDVELHLRPLCAFRDADALAVENTALDPTVTDLLRGFRVRPYGALPALCFTWSGAPATFEREPVWYRGIEYEEELARGYPGHEDQWSPGTLRLALGGEGEAVVAASLGEPIDDPAELWREESRRRVVRASAARLDEPKRVLDLTADEFLYRALDGRPGILAGFPWFGEWGRDTYISLPGLTLARGELELAGEILTAALPFLRGGMLPNVFGRDPEGSSYASADASLWYALAVRRYDEAGASEEELVERFLPALVEIAESYRAGTGLDIACDEGGLPRLGSPDLNPTWMDAVTSTGPVTPRFGFPVETSALWCSLLAHVEDLWTRRGDAAAAKTWRAAKKLAGRTFLERFWIPEKRTLADVWNEGARDESVRPNMIVAAALEDCPLTRGQRTDVVQRVEVELLTPRGLRTLSPKDKAYIGRYGGAPDERDGAYHQGTVWPWLMGFFCEAWLRGVGTRKRDLDMLRAHLDAFAPHLAEAGLLFCSEVFDGDPPHAPGGTIAQAWSSAELLRAYALLDAARK